MIFPGDGDHGDDENDEKGPDEAGDGVEIMAKKLQGKTGGVDAYDIVPHHAEHKEYKRKF